ncbi:DNA repair protein RecO [Sphaerotilus sp.]|uniref:DNA repair protein RecO n=1 Tax=Sphaerotilus sp. TaxID=2093942 RepID=UPI002ACDD88C|nr:recombination protein O N-terminal domain-containing protein [Sphaerotilus sp.]MDZ7857541.1 recombination protein O N-terminal domain-containing protein [Sphaerotilus sp.]
MATRRSAPAAVAAYVLHHHDWSESSLILDLWTREHGRIAAVAKGAKRPHSQLRCVLLPFQRLTIVLGGKPTRRDADPNAAPGGHDAPPDLHLLRSAEWAGGGAMPTGAALLAGFHLNELLLRGLARHDAHPRLFDVYAATLPRLAAHDEAQTAAALRAFELWLLRESGVLPELDRVTLTQVPVRTDVRHGLHPDTGVHPLPDGAAGLGGATLLALQSAMNAFDLGALQQTCQGALPELRTQLRHLLHYHLGTSMLRTRALMVEVQKLTDTDR